MRRHCPLLNDTDPVLDRLFVVSLNLIPSTEVPHEVEPGVIHTSTGDVLAPLIVVQSPNAQSLGVFLEGKLQEMVEAQQLEMLKSVPQDI